MTPAEIRFAADGMLQSLGTWLRLLGYDCVVEPSQSGRRLLEQAVGEDRVFLTRNAHLADNLPKMLLGRAKTVYVAAEHLPEQLREVIGRFSLDTHQFVFTRCVECNRPLEQVTKTQELTGVPPDVLAREPELWRCRHCDKVFWHGSHVRNSLQRLEQWLATDRFPLG
jgi:uncharacterized protein with PIN domain